MPDIGLAQSSEWMQCEMTNSAFLSGEKLTYKVYYNWGIIWIPAGEVSFEVLETDTSYELKSFGTTYPSYDSFFKVRDRYESSINKETLLPTTFVRDIEEGNYLRYDSVLFDQKNMQITEYIGKYKDKLKRLDYTSEGCTQDMVSIMYHLRNIQDERIYEQARLPIHVFFDKEFYNLDINVIGRYNKQIRGLGNQSIIHISPELVTGEVFQEGNEMNIYVSANQSKIPLLIESAVSVGSVKAVLIQSSHTKDKIF